MDRTLLYFADPMCSWCWGFAPVMEKICAKSQGQAELVVMLGGLRPFTDHAMTDKDKAYVRNHWEHVAEASGQSFDFGFFERPDFTYDTEPACRAVVAARRLGPSFAYPMLNRLHRAFYAEGQDTTDPDTLADLAAETGMQRSDFQAEFENEDTKQETLADFHYAQRSQISGFPTLVGIAEGQTPAALTIGFRPWKDMEPAIAQWLSAQE